MPSFKNAFFWPNSSCYHSQFNGHLGHESLIHYPFAPRNADPSSSKIWKNGIIPYKISDEYFFFYKNKIRSAMTDLENKVKVIEAMLLA